MEPRVLQAASATNSSVVHIQRARAIKNLPGKNGAIVIGGLAHQPQELRRTIVAHLYDKADISAAARSG
jgi:hypothetical protein